MDNEWINELNNSILRVTFCHPRTSGLVLASGRVADRPRRTAEAAATVRGSDRPRLRCQDKIYYP